jgi:hypothetical protein
MICERLPGFDIAATSLSSPGTSSSNFMFDTPEILEWLFCMSIICGEQYAYPISVLWPLKFTRCPLYPEQLIELVGVIIRIGHHFYVGIIVNVENIMAVAEAAKRLVPSEV